LDILKTQIKNSLNKVAKKNIGKLIIAYEPVWAIGAKEAMSPTDIHEMSLFIKKVLADIYGHDEALSTTVLYGGSVNFRNAGDIIIKGEVDGLLVGRESINSAGFTELLKVVDSL
jgi:triosephosphate isomerase